jgi:16S rRNA processing protein RimM
VDPVPPLPAGETDAGNDAARPPEGQYLTVGRIGRAHGISGETRVEILTDFPELRFAPGSELLIGPSGGQPEGGITVIASRRHQSALLVRFAGVEDRGAAQALTGMELFVPMEAAAPLPPGAYYVHDLIGLDVLGPDGAAIGRVTSFMETGAADIVIVTTPDGREQLIPLTAQIVTEVDRNAGRMLINPIPGLLD